MEFQFLCLYMCVFYHCAVVTSEESIESTNPLDSDLVSFPLSKCTALFHKSKSVFGLSGTSQKSSSGSPQSSRLIKKEGS